MVKVVISEVGGGQDPQLTLATSVETQGDTWEGEWEASVPASVQDSSPCFLLYRLDDKDAGECYLWVLISWSPDNSPTR